MQPISNARAARIEWTRPLVFVVVFVLVGVAVAIIREKLRYFGLFATIGVFAGFTEYSTMRWPRYRQRIRIASQCMVGGGLFIGLALGVGINFQFSQIFFDACGGVVTGALIQLIIARIFLPFLFGNAFCSKACWDAPFFELFPGKPAEHKPPRPRSELIAWSYLVTVVALTISLAYFWNPASNGIDLTTNANERRLWAAGENLLIVMGGVLLVSAWGRRAYCRMLCPFFTISRLFAKFSVYKIATSHADTCTSCKKCNDSCPMLVNVMEAVKKNQRVLDRNCIACERCVDACSQDCLQYRPGIPWK